MLGFNRKMQCTTVRHINFDAEELKEHSSLTVHFQIKALETIFGPGHPISKTTNDCITIILNYHVSVFGNMGVTANRPHPL